MMQQRPLRPAGFGLMGGGAVGIPVVMGGMGLPLPIMVSGAMMSGPLMGLAGGRGRGRGWPG